MQWIANHKLGKLEEKVDFYKAESLFGSPALSLALRCQADLIDKKMSFDIGLENSDKVIWAQIGSKVVGGICYNFKEFGCGHVLIAFTDLDYRQIGINLLCMKYFENECLKNNMTYFMTEVHNDNHIAYTHLENMGCKPLYTKMIKLLRQS